MSGRDRFFSLQHKYNINQRSNENKEKYQSGDYYQLIKNQVLQFNIIRIAYQKVIKLEILGVKWLRSRNRYFLFHEIQFWE